MVTIGVDPHKQTHTAVAADSLGSQLAQRTITARRDGFGQLLEWGRTLDTERVWVIEDVRHVAGGLERFLLDHGETVVRLSPRLMADARRGVRERGKSDPIDALAIARAALREGLDTLPTARLAGPELEIRLLGVHRERLVGTHPDDQRAALAAARPLARLDDPTQSTHRRVLAAEGLPAPGQRSARRPGADRPGHDQPRA